MKLIIYLLLIGLIIYCIHSNKEKLTNIVNYLPSNFDATNQYDLITNPQQKTFVIDGNSEKLSGFDQNLNIYNTKYWVIKSDGFSDIFNYEDVAGNMIYNQVNIPSGFDPIKVKDDNKKILLDAKNKDLILETKQETNQETNQIKESMTNFDSIPQVVEHEKNKYKLVGSASNPYYYQYYLIYERKVDTKENLEMREELQFINYQVFEYLLVKMNKLNPEIAHHIGPRVKINLNDTIYLALGTFQIGPLIIKSIY